MQICGVGSRIAEDRKVTGASCIGIPEIRCGESLFGGRAPGTARYAAGLARYWKDEGADSRTRVWFDVKLGDARFWASEGGTRTGCAGIDRW